MSKNIEEIAKAIESQEIKWLLER